jgi:hypothetical protein
MAVYVVLSFEDDEEAKEFVTDVLRSGGPSKAGVDIWLAKVRGVFKKPTKFCDPSDGHRAGKKTEQAFTRGRRYGWWVCALCGKPTKAWSLGNKWYGPLGSNLLPTSLVAPERRPQGWKSSAEWEDLLPLLNNPENTDWPKDFAVQGIVADEVKDYFQ